VLPHALVVRFVEGAYSAPTPTGETDHLAYRDAVIAGTEHITSLQSILTEMV
jgi:hypothetical protein